MKSGWPRGYGRPDSAPAGTNSRPRSKLRSSAKTASASAWPGAHSRRSTAVRHLRVSAYRSRDGFLVRAQSERRQDHVQGLALAGFLDFSRHRPTLDPILDPNAVLLLGLLKLADYISGGSISSTQTCSIKCRGEHSAGPALAPMGPCRHQPFHLALVESHGRIVAEGALLSMSALPPKAAARATHWRVR